MEKELTLATPQNEDANVNEELENNSDDTLATTPQEEESQEDNVNIEEPTDGSEEKNEYDSVWDSDEEPEFDSFKENNEQSNEEEPTGSKEELEQEEPKEQKFILKHKGKEIEVDSIDELIALAQKGLDYEFKMTRIKPFRQAIDIIEKNNLEPSDIQALADAKQGKKEAIEYLANKFGIKLNEFDNEIDDIFNDDTKENKKQNDYEPNVQTVNDPVKEFWEEYSQSKPDMAGKVLNIWNELDPTFQQELWNPQTFQAFVGSVETGEFEKVYPKAIKIKALNPALSWIQAYISASQDLVQPKQQKEPTSSVQRQQTKKRSAVKSNYDEYDAVWNEDIPLEELEKQLFGGE